MSVTSQLHIITIIHKHMKTGPIHSLLPTIIPSTRSELWTCNPRRHLFVFSRDADWPAELHSWDLSILLILLVPFSVLSPTTDVTLKPGPLPHGTISSNSLWESAHSSNSTSEYHLVTISLLFVDLVCRQFDSIQSGCYPQCTSTSFNSRTPWVTPPKSKCITSTAHIYLSNWE